MTDKHISFVHDVAGAHDLMASTCFFLLGMMS